MPTATKRKWTEDEIRALGVRTNIPTGCAVLGLGENYGYRLAKRNEFPVPVLRIGRKYVVPVAGLLSALGIDDVSGAA